MVQYTIYTEKFDNLIDITTKYFTGFTIVDGLGYSNNTLEQAAIIIILGFDNDKPKVVELCQEIAKINLQSSVYVTYQKVGFIEVIK